MPRNEITRNWTDVRFGSLAVIEYIPKAAVREIGFFKHNRHAESYLTSTGVPNYAINHVAIAGDLPDCYPPPTPVERVPPEFPIVESPIPINGYAVVVFTISESGEES